MRTRPCFVKRPSSGGHLSLDRLSVGLLFGLITLTLTGLWRAKPEQRVLIAGLPIAGLLWIGSWWFFVAPHRLPLHLVHALQEGTPADVVALTLGVNGHLGPAMVKAWQPLLIGTHGNLRDLAWAGAGLLPITGIWLAFLVARTTRRAWAGAGAVLLWLLAPATLRTAMSDTPMMLGSLLLLSGVGFWRVLHDQSLPRSLHHVAGSGLVVAAWCAGRVRMEWAVPGALAALALCIDLALTRLRAQPDTRPLARMVQISRVHKAAITALCTLLTVLLLTSWAFLLGTSGISAPGTFGGLGGLVHKTFAPPSLDLLKSLAVIGGSWPTGAAIFVLVGMAVSLWHPLRTGMLGPSLLALCAMSLRLAHGSVYEFDRYQGAFGVLWIMLGAIGFSALFSVQTRLRLVPLALLLVPPSAALSKLASPWPADDPRDWPRAPLQRDEPLEARLLLAALAAHPTCVVATQAERWAPSHTPKAPFWASPSTWRESTASAERVLANVPTRIARHFPSEASTILSQAGCVLWLRSRGCEHDAPTCPQIPEDAVRIAQIAGPIAPYVHPAHPVSPVGESGISVWISR